MSKWASLRDTFPAYDDSLTRGEQYGQALGRLRGRSADELTAEINTVRARKDAVEAELKGLNLALDAAEQVLDETLDAAGLDFIGANGYRWTRSASPYPQVVDKAALRDWAATTMPDALSLQYQTLKAVTSARLEAGDAPPPGVSVYVKNTIQRRKL